MGFQVPTVAAVPALLMGLAVLTAGPRPVRATEQTGTRATATPAEPAPLTSAARAAEPTAAPQVAGAAAPSASVEERLTLLTEEVRRLREQLELPTDDAELTAAHAPAPAAGRVYRASPGLSIGGYGEFYFEAPTEQKAASGAHNVADLYRFVTYVGYKFSDRILMNTELEVEHATTEPNAEGESGEVALEFSYLEFLLNPRLNLRTGQLLVPMGLTNTLHEPPFYRGNLRPDVEQTILPTTWRELGMSAHGALGHGVEYTAAVINGLDAKKFDERGIRGGRQEGNHALWEDIAGVLRLEIVQDDRVRAGGSVFHGESDQHQQFDGQGIDAPTTVYEAHIQYRRRGFEGRALFAGLQQGQAAAITRDLFPTSGPAASTRVVPASQWGLYVEAAYDLAPHVGLPASTSLLPWVRYETYDLQSAVPNVPLDEGAPGMRAADPALAVQSLTVGVEVKPIPSVVLKLDWAHLTNDAESPLSDRLRVGAGFVY